MLDIDRCCSQVFESRAVLRSIGTGRESIRVVSISPKLFEMVATSMLGSGASIELWHPEAEAQDCPSGEPSIHGWLCAKRASPGDMSSVIDLIAADHLDDTRCIAAASCKRDRGALVVGVCAVSTIYSGIALGAWTEDTSSESTSCSGAAQLEAVLAQANIAELILPTTTSETSTSNSQTEEDVSALHRAAVAAGIRVMVAPRSSFGPDAGRARLRAVVPPLLDARGARPAPAATSSHMSSAVAASGASAGLSLAELSAGAGDAAEGEQVDLEQASNLPGPWARAVGLSDALTWLGGSQAEAALSAAAAVLGHCGVGGPVRRATPRRPPSVALPAPASTPSQVAAPLKRGRRGALLASAGEPTATGCPGNDGDGSPGRDPGTLAHESVAGSLADCWRLSLIQPQGFARIDAAAVAALGVFGATTARGSQAGGGLFGVVNRCLGGAGSRTMRRWLLQPSTRARTIRWRHACVAALVDDPVCRSALAQGALRQAGDPDSLARKLRTRKAGLGDLVQVYRLVSGIEGLAGALESCEALAPSRLPKGAIGQKDTAFDPTRPWRHLAGQFRGLHKEFDRFLSLVEATINVPPKSVSPAH